MILPIKTTTKRPIRSGNKKTLIDNDELIM